MRLRLRRRRGEERRCSLKNVTASSLTLVCNSKLRFVLKISGQVHLLKRSTERSRFLDRGLQICHHLHDVARWAKGASVECNEMRFGFNISKFILMTLVLQVCIEWRRFFLGGRRLVVVVVVVRTIDFRHPGGDLRVDFVAKMIISSAKNAVAG